MQQESSVNLTEKQKTLLKTLAEVPTVMRIESDNDRVSYMQLIYDGLVSSFGVLTEKGIAYAVLYCGASFYKYIESHEHFSQHYIEILVNCTTPEQVEEKALAYYQKRARQL